MAKYYAVKLGRTCPAIFNTWEECQLSIHGFPRARYKSFPSLASAKKYLGVPDDQIKTEIDRTETNNMDGVVEKKVIKVYTDGSCSRTGTRYAIAGAGIYIPDLDISMSLPVPGRQTNNRGELYAAQQAIFVFSQMDQQILDKIKIEINLDSKYVMNNLGSNNVENLDIWNELLPLLEIVDVSWKKIKAHTGNPGNERADQLAKVIAMSGDKVLQII